MNVMCNTGVGMDDQNSVYPTQALLETFKKNHADNAGLKWQYFGSEDGVLMTYPAAKKCFTDSGYDPRFR